jgi:putative transposase
MQNKKEQLIPEHYYHVYNRANGNELLFLNDENYRFFLQKYFDYISPIANTFCYCLMSNHFHFLIQIKAEYELELFFNQKASSSKTYKEFKTLDLPARQHAISKLLTQQFSHLFNGYTQAFNKQNNRMGSLFMHPYKRKLITKTSYLYKLVHYIHYNPIEAKCCNKPEEWKYSSYHAIITDSNISINKQAVIEWFDDLENFKYIHALEPVELNAFLI